MKAFLNLCLLFILISPVVLLTCKNCTNLKGLKCRKGANANCASDSTCSSLIFNSNVFLDMKIARKSCTPSASCDPGYYSLTTTGGGFLKMLVDCCTTKNCNSRDLKFPSGPMEPNGLECEGCHADRQEKCEAAEMVKCLGDQTKCISMTIFYSGLGAVVGNIFSTKGCATPLICDEEKVNNNMNFGKMSMLTIRVNCTDTILSTEPSSLA